MEKHHDVRRLEGFTDAVFAFAVTLLVVSLEVPRTYDELMASVLEFLPFALTFAMVCWIWYEHNLFFRRYGLQDGWIIFLNSLLLFLVLFYVYPLKFVAHSLILRGETGMHSPEQGSKLMLLYSTGVVMIFGVFVLLYHHAWRHRDELDLTPRQRVMLRAGMRGHALTAMVGMLSIAIATAAPKAPAIAGFIYFLIGPVRGWNGYVAGKAERALAAAETTVK